MTDDDDWITNSLLVTDAVTAADVVEPGDTVLVSGFGGIGYPKRVPEALATAAHYLALTVISRGGIDVEIGDALVEADQMARRFLFQTWESHGRRLMMARLSSTIDISRDSVTRYVWVTFGNLNVAVIKAVAVVRIGLSLRH